MKIEFLRSPEGVDSGVGESSVTPATASGEAPSDGASGGDGGPPPSSAPDAAPSGDIGEADGQVDFSGMDAFDMESEDVFLGSDGEPAEPAPTAPAASPPSPAPATTAPATQPDPATPAAAPAPVSPDPAAVPAPAVAPAPAATGANEPGTPAEQRTFAQVIEQGRPELIKNLTEGRFKLSEEEVERFSTGDPNVISEVMAKVHVDTLLSAVQLMEQAIPNMIQQGLLAQQVNKSADDEFYGQFPTLAPHKQQVVELARTVRKLNPQMPKAEFMQKVASSAAALLGVQLAAAAAPAPTGQGTPAPVARPVNGHAPVVTSVPQAFTPARAPDPNDWGSMADPEIWENDQ